MSYKAIFAFLIKENDGDPAWGITRLSQPSSATHAPAPQGIFSSGLQSLLLHSAKLGRMFVSKREKRILMVGLDAAGTLASFRCYYN